MENKFTDPKIDLLFKQILDIEKEVVSYNEKLENSIKKEKQSLNKTIKKYGELQESIQNSSKNIKNITKSIVKIKTNDKNTADLISSSTEFLINTGAELFSNWKTNKAKKKHNERVLEMKDEYEKNNAKLKNKRKSILKKQLPAKKEIALRKRKILESALKQFQSQTEKVLIEIKDCFIPINQLNNSKSILTKNNSNIKILINSIYANLKAKYYLDLFDGWEKDEIDPNVEIITIEDAYLQTFNNVIEVNYYKNIDLLENDLSLPASILSIYSMVQFLKSKKTKQHLNSITKIFYEKISTLNRKGKKRLSGFENQYLFKNQYYVKLFEKDKAREKAKRNKIIKYVILAVFVALIIYWLFF